MEITPNVLFYTAAISVGLGIVIGLFLFFYGRKKGKQKLGVIGLIVSVVSGAIGPVLPLLVLAVFIFIISRKSPLDSTSVETKAESDEDDDTVL